MPRIGIGLGVSLAVPAGMGIMLSPGGIANMPAGYSRSTIGGAPVTHLGRPVCDNGTNVIYSEA